MGATVGGARDLRHVLGDSAREGQRGEAGLEERLIPAMRFEDLVEIGGNLPFLAS